MNTGQTEFNNSDLWTKLIGMKKRSERRKHCARAGCCKVRTPPARPPVTDTTDYNTLPAV